MSSIILPAEAGKDYIYRVKQTKRYKDLVKQILGAEIARRCGVATMRGTLRAIHCQRVGDSPWNGGRLIDKGLLGARVITNEGVAFLVDDWDTNATDITNMNFHDSGTGTTAEAAADGDLVTPAGPTTRATGTKSQPSANVLRSVGTIAYTGALAITEHGLFSTAARATTELWDRTVFTAINVDNGDSIQFTYDCTLAAGS